MKRFKKSIFAPSIITVLLLISNVSSVGALSINGEDVDWNGRLAAGAGSRINYWIASSSEYYTSIPKAVQKIIYPSGLSNNLVLAKTSSNGSSNLDFYQNYNTSNIIATTSSWKKNSVGKYYQMKTSEKDLGNWTYSEITINDFHMSKYSYAKRETIIAHEILHALGLKDLYSQKNASLIMYGYGSGIPSNGLNLSKLENDVIRAKY